ncbi:MAG: MFS transporter [Thermodesulfobacteriota bacterium]
MTPFRLLCLTGMLAIFSSTISKSPVLPLFAQHLGATPSGIGLIASISAFAGVIFSVPAGLLADRFGTRRLLLTAAAILASAPFAYLLVDTIWQLAMVRLYHGFATAIFLPVAMALVSGLSTKDRGEKMGWFSTATLAGRFLAPVIGGGILGLFSLTSSTGYTTVYWVCGGAGIATFVAAASLPKAEETQARQGHSWAETFHAFKTVILERRIVFTCLVEAAILFAYGTFETFLPLHAVKNDLSASQVGMLLSGQVIVLALTKPVMGRFSDTHGRRPQIVAGGLLGAACVGGLAVATSFPALFSLSLVFGLCLSVAMSATSAYIADLSSQEARGSAMGLLGSVMDLGHTTGPLLSGLVAASFGYGHAFLGSAIVLLGTVGIFSVAARTSLQEGTGRPA